MKTQDGKEYSVRPVADSRSPFDIAGVNLNLSADEIVTFVREVGGAIANVRASMDRATGWRPADDRLLSAAARCL